MIAIKVKRSRMVLRSASWKAVSCHKWSPSRVWYALKLWVHCLIRFHCDVRVWSDTEMMYLCYHCTIKDHRVSFR
jgi:hypothetical protein